MIMPHFSRLLVVCCFLFSYPAVAETELPSGEAINVVWLATASALVFFMQAGFALLESGMSRTKNCINVVMKNYTDVCIGSVVFWLIGFGLMFGNNPSGWFGTSGFAMGGAASWDYSFLLFQTMFAATSATIASGAMAERTHFSSYLIGTVVISAIIYPVFGSWAWGSYYSGSGWLKTMGFIDFAGSSVVHSVGGWCALAAVMVLGPRLGRYDSNGKPRELPGHNLNYVALGGFILWFGWFGFNGGSTLAADVNIGLINLNTQLAAAAGAIGAASIAWINKRPILIATVVNGSLSGLVGITAGCATMEPGFALITGLTAGMIAYSGGHLLISLGLDDVVGAVSVHAFSGAWGTLCAGAFVTGDLFNGQTLLVQAVGVGACFVWSFASAFITFKLIDLLCGLRTDALHEQRGLDFSEHTEVAYPEFVQNSFYTKNNLQDVERR
jgi:ammonium transporter, Amt family